MRTRKHIEEKINGLVEDNHREPNETNFNTLNMQLKIYTLETLLDIRDLLNKEDKEKEG